MTRLTRTALCAAAVAASLLSFSAHAADSVLSFSTFGDSRQDPAKPDPTQLPLSGQDALWLQNTKAVTRIVRSIQAQKPQLLFFNGDMIMGYGRAAVPAGWSSATPSVAQVNATDLTKFNQQYAFWRGLMAPTMEAGTYVVPVPGNHETQCNSANQTDATGMVHPTCPSGKTAVIENEDNWKLNMSDLILDGARFQAMFGDQPSNLSRNPGGTASVPDADGNTTDQSYLTYSFDYRGSHFVVINTDAVGRDSHAPTNWLAADLAAAASRGMTHFFVFGHKPAFTYDYLGNGIGGASNQVAAGGLDVDIPARNAFWAVIEQYGATYFCGHEHIVNAQQPTLSSNGKAWQIIVGAGGSPFDAKSTQTTVSPSTDRSYSWATVNVNSTGTVDVKLYAFSAAYGPTQVIKSITLPQ